MLNTCQGTHCLHQKEKGIMPQFCHSSCQTIQYSGLLSKLESLPQSFESFLTSHCTRSDMNPTCTSKYFPVIPSSCRCTLHCVNITKMSMCDIGFMPFGGHFHPKTFHPSDTVTVFILRLAPGGNIANKQ